MQIHGTKTIGNTIRVSIFLAEKGVDDIPFVPVDLFGGEHKKAEFARKNPAMQVPVLELDDGTFIAETEAICRYLENFHPDPHLFGTDPLSAAMVSMWHRRMETQLLLPSAQVRRHTTPSLATLEPVQLADWAELNRPRAQHGLAILDAQLADNAYVAGRSFSFADITVIFALKLYLGWAKAIPAEFPNVQEWDERVQARPSVAWLNN